MLREKIAAISVVALSVVALTGTAAHADVGKQCKAGVSVVDGTGLVVNACIEETKSNNRTYLKASAYFRTGTNGNGVTLSNVKVAVQLPPGPGTELVEQDTVFMGGTYLTKDSAITFSSLQVDAKQLSEQAYQAQARISYTINGVNKKIYSPLHDIG
ncbi:hypothetical protein [Streptomyces chartreusis]|uniref:hypothetical protein n=1 Tax=Streptomyces chartreusis TaxID=1969 RepID=UPI0036746DD8